MSNQLRERLTAETFLAKDGARLFPALLYLFQAVAGRRGIFRGAAGGHGRGKAPRCAKRVLQRWTCVCAYPCRRFFYYSARALVRVAFFKRLGFRTTVGTM